jgi:hypothetical protein
MPQQTYCWWGPDPYCMEVGQFPRCSGLSLNLRIYITGEETREGDIDLLFLLGDLSFLFRLGSVQT